MSSCPAHAATLTTYFDAVNQDRFDDAAGLFAAEARLTAPGIEPQRGRNAVARYICAALAPYPEHRDSLRRILVAGDTATVEIEVGAQTASGFRSSSWQSTSLSSTPAGRSRR